MVRGPGEMVLWIDFDLSNAEPTASVTHVASVTHCLPAAQAVQTRKQCCLTMTKTGKTGFMLSCKNPRL